MSVQIRAGTTWKVYQRTHNLKIIMSFKGASMIKRDRCNLKEELIEKHNLWKKEKTKRQITLW